MLKQNLTNNAQYPRRMIGGGNAQDRTMFGRTSLRNQWAGQGGILPTSGLPVGNLAGGSWSLPPKAGGMSSRNISEGSATLSASGAAVQTQQNIAAAITAGAVVSGQGAMFGLISATIVVNTAQATANQIADAVWNKTLP
jgi:hypothetical protein